MSKRARRRRQLPAEEPSGIWKFLVWLVRHELAFVVVGGLVFAVVQLLPCVVGAGIALSFAAPLTGIALGLVIGAVLGFFGPHRAYWF